MVKLDREDPLTKLFVTEANVLVVEKALRRIYEGEDPQVVVTEAQLSYIDVVVVWTTLSRQEESIELLKKVHPFFSPILLKVFSPIFPKTPDTVASPPPTMSVIPEDDDNT